MINLIYQCSKYIIVIFMILYTLLSFTAFLKKNRDKQNAIFRKQRTYTLMIHFILNLLLLLNEKEVIVLELYVCQIALYITMVYVYQFVYRKLSRLVLNHMMFLLMIGLTELVRLDWKLAARQMMFAAAGLIICLFVPLCIERIHFVGQLGWIYGTAGISILLYVLKFGVTKYGAKNWIMVAGFSLQPSEFVKILFVFFVASLLAKSTKFKHVVAVTAAAALYVLILVLEKDLGSAMIFFITYLFMLYTATANAGYLLAGFGGGGAAAVVAYKLFSHVRVRVLAWKDPWGDIDHGGYQIAQSLFAIGTGGWFGMGFCKGLPTSIPVRESDFIFAAISEELGGIFAICLILIYVSCFIMFINISVKMERQFYKLCALGLSVLTLFQVFVSVGGVTKFIPSTGVTLPLLSYGGSSILSTIIIFGIIQGLYVLNQDEERKNEKRKRKEKQKESYDGRVSVRGERGAKNIR